MQNGESRIQNQEAGTLRRQDAGTPGARSSRTWFARRFARRFASLLVLVALLAGCADLAQLFPSGEVEAQAVGTGAFVAPAAEATYPSQMSTAARILARGAMVVGVRYDLEPFSYIAADSQLAGMEIDLAHELARRWLGSAEAVRFRQVRSDTAYQYLAEGTVDVVFAGLTHTQEAEARADFSPAYFANGMALLTFPDTGIQELAQISEKRVGIVSWTDSSEALAASASVTPTLVVYDHYFDVIDALRLREIDAYADQRHRLERARRSITGSAIVGQWTQEPVAMIFRQDDPFFYNLVQLTFQDMAADGTRDALFARWLPGTSPPSLPVMPGNVPTPQLAAAPQQVSTLDVMARIRDRQVLTVGYFVDRWPYSADRADGVPTGFTLRLVERIAELWLGSISTVTFVPIANEQDALQRLERGDVDMLAGTWVHTRDAELGFDFSIPILDDGVSIMSPASAKLSAAFSDLGQLSGQPVGVVAGSAAEAAVPSLSQGTGLSAVGYPSFGDALAALQSGEVVALLSERQPTLELHFREEGFSVSDLRFTTRPVAFMLPEGDSDFRDLVSATLMALEAQGIYQELYSLWFDDAVPQLQTLPGHAATSLSVGQ